MSKPWANIGAWAADAEQAEAEEREAAAAAAESNSFPSLKEAVTAAKPKKKKPMSLMEFNAAAASSAHTGLTPNEMLRLPTGPKERSPEEMQFNEGGRWGGGGGRRSYGGGGGFDDERAVHPSRVSDPDQPSRADEVDNWASVKRTLPSVDSGRQNRYGSLGGGSRAEEVDNWAVGKKQPIAAAAARSPAFGSGFRESGPEPDRWARGDRSERPTDRPRLVLDPPRINEGVAKANPFGAARPREEVLAEKGLDWKKIDLEIEAKKTPTSEHSGGSRPSSAHSTRSEGPTETTAAVKARPKVNPFGDAKPREVLLEERGQDWKKIDLELEHRRVDRSVLRVSVNVFMFVNVTF